MAGRTSAIEFEMRVTEIEQLCLNGYTRAEIVTYCNNKQWGVNPRTIDKYISVAMQKIQEINKGTAEQTLSIILTNLWMLFRKCADDREKHKLLLSISKLNGLDKISLHVNVDDQRVLKDLSNDELLAAIGKDKEDE